jgi:hypothetical protein
LVTIFTYTPIQPNYIGDLPRVATYWRKDAPFQYRQLNHLYDNPDVIVLNITGPRLIEITLINVYNEKRQGKRIGIGQYTVKRYLQRMNARERILVCGDFNTYYLETEYAEASNSLNHENSL